MASIVFIVNLTSICLTQNFFIKSAICPYYHTKLCFRYHSMHAQPSTRHLLTLCPRGPRPEPSPPSRTRPHFIHRDLHTGATSLTTPQGCRALESRRHLLASPPMPPRIPVASLARRIAPSLLRYRIHKTASGHQSPSGDHRRRRRWPPAEPPRG
jgi:hypothetical protein